MTKREAMFHLAFIVVLFSVPVVQAQPVNPDGYRYIPSGAQKLIPGKSGMYSQAMLSQHANAVALISERPKSGEAEIHAEWDDQIFVQQGEAVIVLGGSVENPREVGPGETYGSGISGGTRITVQPGDFIYVPAKTAHQWIIAPGKTLRCAIIKTRP